MDFSTTTLKKVKKLGEGREGQVFLMKDQTGKKYAVKIARSPALSSLLKEHNILGKLSKYPECHPFIACDYGLTKIDGRQALVLDYIQGQDLRSFIKVQTLSEPEILRFVSYLFEGLAYIHSKNIVHRDIKPQNIILTKKDIKIIDFGLACTLEKCLSRYDEGVGTPYYMAPEMLLKGFIKDSTKLDIWSMGIVTYLMTTGHTPWKSKTIEEFEKEITSKLDMKDIPEKTSIVIQMCLQQDPTQRPTAAEMVLLIQ